MEGDGKEGMDGGCWLDEVKKKRFHAKANAKLLIVFFFFREETI